jgi:hypothetical protein
MGYHRSALGDNMIPATQDPSWKTWAGPLRNFLHRRQRDWKELEDWGKRSGIAPDILRHMLAWMSIQRLASWTGTTWKLKRQ